MKWFPMAQPFFWIQLIPLNTLNKNLIITRVNTNTHTHTHTHTHTQTHTYTFCWIWKYSEGNLKTF